MKENLFLFPADCIVIEFLLCSICAFTQKQIKVKRDTNTMPVKQRTKKENKNVKQSKAKQSKGKKKKKKN